MPKQPQINTTPFSSNPNPRDPNIKLQEDVNSFVQRISGDKDCSPRDICVAFDVDGTLRIEGTSPNKDYEFVRGSMEFMKCLIEAGVSVMVITHNTKPDRVTEQLYGKLQSLGLDDDKMPPILSFINFERGTDDWMDVPTTNPGVTNGPLWQKQNSSRMTQEGLKELGFSAQNLPKYYMVVGDLDVEIEHAKHAKEYLGNQTEVVAVELVSAHIQERVDKIKADNQTCKTVTDFCGLSPVYNQGALNSKPEYSSHKKSTNEDSLRRAENSTRRANGGGVTVYRNVVEYSELAKCLSTGSFPQMAGGSPSQAAISRENDPLHH
jgi:hypothetical protein